MLVVNLQDEPYDIPANGFRFIITDYQSGSYEGDGTAVMLLKYKDELHIKSLGHCSCYGPFDNAADITSVSVNEFLHADNIHSYNIDSERLIDRVKQELNELGYF